MGKYHHRGEIGSCPNLPEEPGSAETISKDTALALTCRQFRVVPQYSGSKRYSTRPPAEGKVDQMKKKSIREVKRKVFDVLMEQRESQIQGTGLQEPEVQFAELPPPREGGAARERLAEAPTAPTKVVSRAAVVATLRVGSAAIDSYEGADAAVVEALCKAVRHVE